MKADPLLYILLKNMKWELGRMLKGKAYSYQPKGPNPQ